VSSLGKDSESIFLTEEENRKWQNFLNMSEQSTGTKVKKSLDEDNRIRVLLQAESLDRINTRKRRDRIVKRLDSRFSDSSPQAG
jgi:predicted DNA binding CopG/RHH family protein